MAILLKGCKPDNIESHSSLNSFTNIRGFAWILLSVDLYLNQNSPDILALCEANVDDSINSGIFLWRVIFL